MPSARASTALRIVRLPGRMRPALRLFREMSGLAAVASVATPVNGGAPSSALSPPVHPRCAARLRAIDMPAPCRKQWILHVRYGRRSGRVDTHRCPVGLQCSCIPIRFDRDLVGLVKLVAGPETSARAFSAATRLLDLIVAGVCEESVVSMLSEEVEELRLRVAELRQAQSKVLPVANGRDSGRDSPATRAARRRNRRLVEKALSHLHGNYQAPGLSLAGVAQALGCNPRYLTTRFTSIVGERMHSYLVRLRVGHACRLLVESAVPIKEVAYASGFRGNTALARAFRRHVGVSPGEYRGLFG